MAANMTQLGSGQLGRRPPPNQQLPQMLYTQIIQHPVPTSGWRSSVSPNMRVGLVMNIITNTLLAIPGADSSQVIGGALTFEREAFTSSQDKATYETRIMGRINELFKKRQANEQNMQNSLSHAAAAQAQAQAQNQAQMIMNQNMQMRSLGQPTQQGFQALHQQMQTPPINQQGQPNIGLNHPNGLPMNPNQQVMQMGAQMRPQMTPLSRIAGLSPQDHMKAQHLAVRKVQELTEPVRNQIRTTLSQKYGPQNMAQLQHEGHDPLVWFYQSQIGLAMVQNAAKAQASLNQSGMPAQAHQQRSMNQPGQQLPTGPNGEYGPFANVESIMNQQKAGLIAQEAGQMVVPASSGAGRNATPQPMGSVPGPNQGAGQPTLPHQPPQQFNHQPAQQLKMDQLAAQSQAQIRAQAQAKQIHGQPGGLNGPGGTSQSPAMNTLNTPVRRPPMGVGQTEGYAQMGQGNMPFGQQVMDPRFNQNGQRTPGGPNGNIHKQQVLHGLLQQLPPEAQQHFMNVPPEKMHESILKWQASRGVGPIAGRPQPQNGPLGSVNPISQPMNQPQSMNQFQAANNHFGQHPNANMQMNQHSQAMMQQMSKMRGPNMSAGSLDRQAFMDNMIIPQKILDQLRLSSPQGNLFPDIKKWAQLKQWMAQKTLPQQTIQSLLTIQNAQFQTILKAAQGSANASLQPPQPNPVQQGIHTNGQANPQMVQPATTIAGSSPEYPISAAEVQAVRNTNPEKFKDYPDDQIRQLIMQMKTRALQKTANKTAGLPARGPQVTQSGHTAAASTSSQPAIRAMTSQGQQTVGPETSTASPAVQGRNIKQPQNRPAPNTSVVSTTKAGTKRPMPDDTADVPNASNTPVQRPHGQQAQPSAPSASHRTSHMSSEQAAAMQPEQQQKSNAMVNNRQSAQATGMSEEVARLKAIGQEQHLAAMKEHLPDIPMSPEQHRDVAQRIQSMCVEMNKMGKVLVKWYSLTRNDGLARSFFQFRIRLVKQYVDGEKMTILKDKFSITPAELDSIRNLIETMAKDVTAYISHGMRKNPSQQQSSEPAPAQAMAARPGAQTTHPAPLNAANLEKQTQALNRMHQRNNSRAGQPPAAPTTAQPPFSFGAQSPDGQPTYATKPAITQENLQLPARKKVKTEARTGSGPNQTGSSTNASPQVQKLSSPEVGKRQAPPEAKPTATIPKFLCSDQYCEFRSIGFPTEEALHKHMDEEHVKPAGNPMKFAVEGLAEVMGLDSNGKIKKTPAGGNVQSSADTSKHIQTPTGRAEPPISREAPMKRQGSTAGSKQNELIRTIAGKASTPKPDFLSKTPDGVTAIMAHATGGEVMGSTIDPQELLSGVTGLEMGGGGAILDMNVYRALTPNDTPESSKDSASSEPNSDVSEGVALNVNIDMGFDSWDPFGFGYGSANMELGNIDNFTGLSYPGYSWDEVNPDFDKPFSLNTGLFSLDAS